MGASRLGQEADFVEIVYRDEHFVAVNKPSGLLVHRTSIDARESAFLLQTVRDQIGSYVHTVHRIDKGASGVVLFALHAEAARRMGIAFREELVRKIYVAIVRGYAPEHVLVEHVLRDRYDAFDARRIQTRSAVTDVHRLACVELPFAVGRYPTARYSFVMCQPKTGRRHQVRRHMKHLRHPIIGDSNYGDGVHNRFFRERLGVQRLLLAATELRFTHPFSGEEIEIRAPLDGAFREVLARLEWRSSPSDSERLSPDTLDAIERLTMSAQGGVGS